MSDTPELVFPAAEPVQDVCVEVIAELAPAAEAPNVPAETADVSAQSATAAPAVGVEDLHHIHMGFLQVSVREGVARLEALIAKLEA